MSSTRASGPIWARPEPGGRRPRFTRQQIAAVALAIADAEGFGAVSMRRVAAELGAGTMTLYYYVRSKDELLDLMDCALMADVLIPDGGLPTCGRDGRLLPLAGRRHSRRSRGGPGPCSCGIPGRCCRCARLGWDRTRCGTSSSRSPRWRMRRWTWPAGSSCSP